MKPSKIAAVVALSGAALAGCIAVADDSSSGLVEIHEFHGSGGSAVGYLFGVPVNGVPGAYQSLKIKSGREANAEVLYTVQRTALIGSAGLEQRIHDDGSYGFRAVVLKDTYAVLSCCAVGGGAMDDITIEWVPDASRFAFLRTP